VGAAVTRRRVLEPGEWRQLGILGAALCALSILVIAFPSLVAYPAAALALWGGLALLWKAFRRPR
jgi:hypothetical protein